MFFQAITYYEHSIKGGGPSSLKYDLANLLMKLKSYEKCEKILNIAIDLDKDSNEFEKLQERTRYLLLLAKVIYHRHLLCWPTKATRFKIIVYF